MHYTEPRMLKTGDAISLVQQVDLTTQFGAGKTCDVFLDSAVFPVLCTLFAYEADE